MDPKLFASVMKCVNAAAKRLGVTLPTRKQAEILAKVYDRWRATGRHDRQIVEELVAEARATARFAAVYVPAFCEVLQAGKKRERTKIGK